MSLQEDTVVDAAAERLVNCFIKKVFLRSSLLIKQANQPITNRHDQLFELAEVSPLNLYRYYEQSRVDPSMSTESLAKWESKLRQAIQTQGVKHDYAALFGRLVAERLSDTSVILSSRPIASNSEADDGPAEVEDVGRAEQHEQRKEWESKVFQKASLDQAKLLKVLESTFGSEAAVKALDDLRDSVEDFCVALRDGNSFDTEAVQWCVKEILKREILTDLQSATLREVVANPVYLSELADILNIRFKALDEWSWGKEAIPVEMRRQLNGRYRVFMHEEVTQALFLHFIGMKWSVFFKGAFLKFFDALAWTKPLEMSKADLDRRTHFLNEVDGHDAGIAQEMRTKYRSQYFMSQLPDKIDSGIKSYGDDNITKEASQTSRNPLGTKQSLLHFLFSESLVANRVHKGSVVIQSDFKWFGPSLPHATILTVLKFFGVDQSWLVFFEKFLEAPLRFIHDGPNGPVQPRKCGIPMAHALSDAFGESVLFCLDYAVNQATNGAVLYRLHDDFWFWAQDNDCIMAWTAITSFAEAAGLEMNPEKTGAARITSDELAKARPLPRNLPKSPIRSGLLVLNIATGRFEIDQTLVDTHIIEFRRQLQATKSVFAWIQAYNTYVQFLINHSCTPANCFGQAHVDDCLTTLARVHQKLFPHTNGNAAQVVKAVLRQKFAVDNVPDGLIYFPMSLGGLALRNPFISLQAMRANVVEDPNVILDEAFEDEAQAYRQAKSDFETSASRTWNPHHVDRPDEFISWEEYTRNRRARSKPFQRAWLELQEVVAEEPLKLTPRVERLLGKLPAGGEAGVGAEEGILREWERMTPYWKVIVSLYAEEMEGRFGGLAVVEKALLPMGLVGLWRGRKVKWEG